MMIEDGSRNEKRAVKQLLLTAVKETSIHQMLCAAFLVLNGTAGKKVGKSPMNGGGFASDSIFSRSKCIEPLNGVAVMANRSIQGVLRCKRKPRGSLQSQAHSAV